MSCEGGIAGGPWQGAPASEGRRDHTDSFAKSPARWALSSAPPEAEFAALWIAARYGVPLDRTPF